MKTPYSGNKSLIVLFLVFIFNTISYSDENYESEDFRHYLELLKSNDTHIQLPAYYNAIRDRGHELRPRILELMRRVELDQSAFGELDNQDLTLLLYSQIDNKLVNNDDDKADGMVSLRILISQMNQVTRILYFDRENLLEQEMNLMHWIRNFPSGAIDLQMPPSDWKLPKKSRKKWTLDDFTWLNPIFDDPMPPIDFPAEIVNRMNLKIIFEKITIVDGSASYEWAIRSSRHTSGYLLNFELIFIGFLQQVNQSLDDM